MKTTHYTISNNSKAMSMRVLLCCIFAMLFVQTGNVSAAVITTYEKIGTVNIALNEQYNAVYEIDNITATENNTVISEKAGARLISIPSGYTGTISIPATVNYEGTDYKVLELGNKPNSNNTNSSVGAQNLSGIDFTNASNVEYIRVQAFSSCTKLTTLTGLSGLTSLKVLCEKAFMNTSIEGVLDLSGCTSLTYIQKSVFENTKISKAILPASITKMDHGVFRVCPNLTEIVFPENCQLTSLPAILCAYKAFSGTASGTSNLTTINFGALKNITEIADSCFMDCKALTEIDLSECTSLTTVSKLAFQNCENLTSITLPESLTTIEKGAFTGCNKLEEIHLPASMLEVGEEVFKGCTSLKKVYCDQKEGNAAMTTIAKNAFSGCTELTLFEFDHLNKLETIGEGAFKNCAKLESDINLSGSKLTTIEKDAFNGCKKITTTSFPSSLKTLGASVFNSATALNSVTFASNTALTSIPDYAFSGCSALPDITGLGNLKNITSIGMGAFNNCSALATDFDLSNSKKLEEIKEKAFAGCAKIQSIKFPYSLETLSATLGGCTILKDVTFAAETGHPSALKEIKSNTFKNCANLETIDGFSNLANITYIGQDAFSGCKNLTSPVDLSKSTSLTTIASGAFTNCKKIPSISFPSSLATLDANFSGCTGLQDVTFAENMALTALPANAFNNCTALSSVVGFANLVNLETVGSKAFYNCTSLNCDVDLSTSKVATIESEAFSAASGTYVPITSISFQTTLKTLSATFGSCNKLATVSFAGENNALESIPANTFKGCTALTTVNGLGNLKKVGTICQYAFGGCTGLGPEIDMSGMTSLSTIEQNAFNGCTAITSFKFPGSLAALEEKFASCTELVTVNFAENNALTTIASGTIQNCTKLASINLGNLKGLKTIKANAFSGCTSLGAEVDLSGATKLNTIEETAFNGCTAVNTFKFPGSLATLGEKFASCTSLGEVNFAENNALTTIAAGTFQNCTALSAINIENLKALTTIEENAFNGCTSITSLSFPASLTALNEKFASCSSLAAVSFAENSALPTIKSGTFKDCTALTTVNGFSNLKSLTKIEADAFSGCGNLAQIVDLSGATSLATIEETAFKDCAMVTAFKFPGSLATLGEKFASCTSLGEVNFAENNALTTIAAGTFQNCAALSAINIENLKALTTIEEDAFSGCTDLTSLSFPASLTTLDEKFASCTSLAAVSFAENSALPTIKSGTFKDCTALTTVNGFSNLKSLTKIEADAFSGCSNLAQIVDLSGATALATIEETAFKDCAMVTSFKFPGSLATLGEKFASCTSLGEVNFAENNALTTIAAGTFQNCTALSAINIENLKGLTTIEEDAFSGCSALTSLSFPASLTTLDEKFASCTSLAAISFAENSALTNINEGTFKNCASLTSVNGFSNLKSLTTIGEEAFANCSNLATIDFSGATELTEIKSAAFKNAAALTNVNLSNSKLQTLGTESFAESGVAVVSLPTTMKTIGQQAFSGCSDLATINIAGLTNLESIGKESFKDCSSLGALDLSATKVATIGIGAFAGCNSIEEIKMPATIETIANNAFSINSSVLNIYMDNTTPPALGGANALPVNPTTVVYIPECSYANYTAGTCEGSTWNWADNYTLKEWMELNINVASGNETGSLTPVSEFTPGYYTLADAPTCTINIAAESGYRLTAFTDQECGNDAVDKLTANMKSYVFDMAHTRNITALFSAVDGVKWNGTADNDWFNTANWHTGNLPKAGDDVYILSSATTMPVITGDDLAVAKSIEIEDNATLTISDGRLEVADKITVIDNGKVVINQSADEMSAVRAKVVDKNGALATNTVVNRTLKGQRTYLIGSATAEGTVSGTAPDDFRAFDSEAGEYSAATGFNGDKAAAVTFTESAEEQTLTQVGTLRSTEAYSFSFDGLAADSWSLIANPYLLPLQLPTEMATTQSNGVFAWNGGMSPNMYFESENSTTTYSLYAGIGVVSNSSAANAAEAIAPTQGFFVNGGIGASLTIDPSSIDMTSLTTTSLKSAGLRPDVLRLTLSTDAQESDEMAFVFNSDGSLNYGSNDALKRAEPATNNSIYSIKDAQKLSISIMPLTTTIEEEKLAIGVQLPAGVSDGVFEATNLSEFDNATEVYLYDAEEDTYTDLREETFYSFSVADAGSAVNDRFFITFKKEEQQENPTLIENTEAGSISIVAVGNNKALVVADDALLTKDAKAVVYSVSGQILKTVALSGTRTYIDLDPAVRVSIVKAFAGGKSATLKIAK